ncbi:MAG: crotonase/enoyl-CoA hydratase family protein [Candidatus Nanopelagicales bacterium]|nr:crotonase/enoyl-CoA hydratase family protein [Candidatus Nanopelagicales bacterium]
MSDVLLTEKRGGVFIMTMNRPEARNALSRELMYEMAEALHEFDIDNALAVAVLTGAGGNFCSGMDLREFAAGSTFDKVSEHPGLNQQPPAKPIIAAVEGYALAGGCETALCTDIIVASRDAKFGIPEVKRGLVAAGGGLYRLPRVMSYPAASLLALTGDIIDAEQANAWGLVSVLADAGGALNAALDIAERIAANGPLALKATKAVLAKAATWTDPEFMAWQQTVVGPVFASNDAKEGATAFGEKRAPKWTAT